MTHTKRRSDETSTGTPGRRDCRHSKGSGASFWVCGQDVEAEPGERGGFGEEGPAWEGHHPAILTKVTGREPPRSGHLSIPDEAGAGGDRRRFPVEGAVLESGSRKRRDDPLLPWRWNGTSHAPEERKRDDRSHTRKDQGDESERCAVDGTRGGGLPPSMNARLRAVTTRVPCIIGQQAID